MSTNRFFLVIGLVMMSGLVGLLILIYLEIHRLKVAQGRQIWNWESIHKNGSLELVNDSTIVHNYLGPTGNVYVVQRNSQVLPVQFQGGPAIFEKQPDKETINSVRQYASHGKKLKTRYYNPLSGCDVEGPLRGFRFSIKKLAQYGFTNPALADEIMVVFGVRPEDLRKSTPDSMYFTLSLVKVRRDFILQSDIDNDHKILEFAMEYCDACPPHCPKNFYQIFK